ncbi:MAG: heme exporter protein CcmD [Xanthomonadales bacterium]|nr:heme exporter protein CcmD [Xanthomonadales bacterium]NNL96298.1 heme exporter protein CcmD [Xanthomonadales bacterium]
MSHTPFIIASYLAAAVLLTWCAVTPLLRKRRLLRNIRITEQGNRADRGGDHAPDA